MCRRHQRELRDQHLAEAWLGQAEGYLAHELGGEHSSFLPGSWREADFGQERQLVGFWSPCKHRLCAMLGWGGGFLKFPKCYYSSQWRGQSLEQKLQIRGLWAWPKSVYHVVSTVFLFPFKLVTNVFKTETRL